MSVMLSSCTSFEKEWESSVAAYGTGTTVTPEGPWTGSWTTTSNGHTGKLRAIVRKSPRKAGEYQFRYHATWAKIFSGGYTVSYPVTRSGDSYRVSGDQKLGIFGTFGHQGKIQGERFEASISNKKGDIGVFVLERP
ncbi:MAG: hypothetical protein P1U68_03930 [Verrucomicrobiales bacterium]|nr:hypothetical protein [Verrucomicrobiales bacterium]